MKKNLRSLVGCLSMVALLVPRPACARSCLPTKLAGRVKAAGSVYGRLETYVGIARRQSSELGRCLASYEPWDDRLFSLTGCNPHVPLDIVECAWSEMQGELGAWTPDQLNGQIHLVHLRGEVAKAYESYQRAVKSPPAFLMRRIERTRWLIEDIEADLARMTRDAARRKGGSPSTGPPPLSVVRGGCQVPFSPAC
jgi:hypothetical protein